MNTRQGRLKEWLLAAVDAGASDLHLIADFLPVIRCHGELHPIDLPAGDTPNSNEEVQRDLLELCPQELRDRLLKRRNLDFALQLEQDGQLHRFRANYFFAGDQLGACFRLIPSQVPDWSWANFPPNLADRLIRVRNGLILFSGVAGSGKTTK